MGQGLYTNRRKWQKRQINPTQDNRDQTKWRHLQPATARGEAVIGNHVTPETDNTYMVNERKLWY